MPEPIDLSGRTAVVTGASRGIGAAIARILGAYGASLVLHGRTISDELTAVGAAISAESGVHVVLIDGDGRHAATADALAKAAFHMDKRLDIWVNNLGQLQESMIGMTPSSAIEDMTAINLNSVLFGTQAAARLMRRNGHGSIINIASIMGRYGQSGIMSYCASKAGVIGATYAAAKELAPANIRVNALAPGFIETDMTIKLDPVVRDQKIAAIGIGRAGTADDVANAALFLASDLSVYVTGQVIGVDGGMTV